MSDPIEEAIEVQVDHPLGALLEVAASRPHGLVRRAPGTKAEALLRERGVEDRAEHLLKGLLDQPPVASHGAP